MSSGAVESKQEPAHIAGVDVDATTREDGSECELSCDSGLESKSSCPTEAALPPETSLSPSKSEESGIKLDIKMESEDLQGIKTPPSISHSSASSPGANTSDNFSNLDDFLSSQIEVTNDEDKAVNQNIMDTCNNNDNDIIAMLSQSEVSSNDSVNQPDTYLEANKSLATSTVSLYEATNTNITICKSPYSRSAENISIDVKTGQSNVDRDTILSQFKSQKSKVSATHVMTPDAQTTLDVRYPRIPKEILSQDLGSIVKNVHGIFSSVSGSLKSAYTYRTGQMPYMKAVKPMPNGKLMNDIFEDEQNDEKITNSIEALKTEPNVNETAEVIDQSSQILNGEDNDVKGDVLRLQIESLEKVLGEQRRENSVLRERVKQQADELHERDQTFKELEVKIDMMSKRVEQAEREKDAAVMRYASVECSAIEARRAADAAAKAEKAALAEAELLNNKIKGAREDKQRICQLYDDKCHELQNCDRELSKVREDVKELEGRLKWTQSKLRMEMDAYKDSAERVEKLTAQVSELEAARDAATANATDSLRAKQLESELKESQAALILCRHEREDLERRLAAVTLQLDASRAARDAASAALATHAAEAALILCRHEREDLERRLAAVTLQLDASRAARDAASAALATHTAEVESLKESNRRLEQEAAELAALRAQAALADSLSAQLQRETERAAQAEEALGRERARAETCARREAGALEHAARLTAQHVQQRARASHATSQAQALSADNVSLRERVAALEAECQRLQTALTEETERRHKESKVLARKVAEMQEEVAEANKQLEWEKGENGVLKKKHASAIKELNRELQRTLKRCEQLEAKLPTTDAPSTRTGSITSLSSSESAPHDDRLQNGHSDVLPEIQVREPDKQALIERIVSLQRAAARRAERCEFLEEHARQLTDELRTKARLLRHLLPSLPAQALSSTASDSNKPVRRLTKKEIARHGGGAMAALWGGDPGGLTLELSLEMNKRLQAVLEDTLLKNITLKENMDTLGEEIARLKGHRNSTTDSK